MSVQRRDRHLPQPSLTPFCDLLLHRVSVQRRDRRTIIICPCEFLRSHSVSVQRRDRSLFFFLHCSTKVRFYLFALIYLVIVAFFQDFFSQPFYSVSVQRRGRYSVSCFDLARPLLFSAAFFWFHSVSVQRRDRCSVSYFDLSQDPFCFPLLSSGFTVCLSKDVTGALLPTPLTPLFVSFSSPPFLFMFV